MKPELRPSGSVCARVNRFLTGAALIFFLTLGVAVGNESSRSKKTLSQAESSDGRVCAVLVVQPAEPRLSDTILLTLIVTADETLQLEMPTFGTAIGDLRLLEIAEESVSDKDGTKTCTLTLRTAPTQGGTTPIWPMTIRYTDLREGLRNKSQSLQLPGGELFVQADVKPEDASLDKIPAARDLIDIPSRRWYGLLAGGLLVVLSAILLLLRYRSRARKKPAEPVTPLSARDIALQRLTDLLRSRLYESDVKQFYVELTNIVRWYIERRTRIRAPELTTEEFLREIADRGRTRSMFSPELQERLRLFLESADRVKFAKFLPMPEEVLLGARRAEEFLAGMTQEENDPFPTPILREA